MTTVSAVSPSETFNLGNSTSRLRLTQGLSDPGVSGPVRIGFPHGDSVRVGSANLQPSQSNESPTKYLNIDPSRLADQLGASPGDTLEVTIGGRRAGFVDIVGPSGFDPSAGDGSEFEEGTGSELGGPEPVDPSNYPGIVNADNQSGIAFAPSLVRQGRTADSDGTLVDLEGGPTVTVYPRQESDEAIRDPSTGAPVDTPVGSGGVEGGVDSDGSGMIGGAVAVFVLLMAAAAALVGGGD